jgi:hypothetical protein
MKSRKAKKPFKDWKYEEVNEAFGLKRVFDHPFFAKITHLKLAKDHAQYHDIDKLRHLALEYIGTWNEDEYKFFFISPLLALVNFNSQYYKAFAQRPLSVTYDNGAKTTEGFTVLLYFREEMENLYKEL